MKINRTSWLAGGLSLFMLAFASVSQAATVASAGASNIFLAFRNTNGTGSSYLVNLGDPRQFTQAVAGTSFNLSSINLVNATNDVIGTYSLGNIGADLAATFGAGWATDSSLSWALFGRNSATVPTLYASRAENPFGTDALAWPALDDTSRQATASQINSVISNFNTLQATANNANLGAVQANAANSGSYNFQVAPGQDFGSLSQWTGIEASGVNGITSTSLDLFRLNATTTNLGTFTISNTGALNFTAGVNAVPEPSKTLFALVGGVAVFLRRRRSSNPV